MSSSSHHRVDRRFLIAAGVLGLLAFVTLALSAQPADARKGEAKVKVMTRNLFLGADLGPGIDAKNFDELKDAAGQILNQVDENKFQVRAKGLATEILRKKPDLVGLQEAALWRDAPAGLRSFRPRRRTSARAGTSSGC